MANKIVFSEIGFVIRISKVPFDESDYIKKMGLEWDASEFGLGLRCVRFALLLEGVKITEMFVEEVPSHVNLTAASNILKVLS